MNGMMQASSTANRPMMSQSSPAYHAVPQPQADACMQTPMSSQDDQSHRLIHDALSDIDNRKVKRSLSGKRVFLTRTI